MPEPISGEIMGKFEGQTPSPSPLSVLVMGFM